MTDRINALKAHLDKAVQGLPVDVSISHGPNRSFLDVRAYFTRDDRYDFECTWTFDGLRWDQPDVQTASKGGSYGDVRFAPPVPSAAEELFANIGNRIVGYGKLSPSEHSLLSVLTDIEFDVNDLSSQQMRDAIEVACRELTFRTFEQLVETVHDSARAKEFRANAQP